MTAARFDAPASTSQARHFARPPYAQRDGVAFRVVRLIWLTTLLARRDPVRIADYQRRFGMSLRSFRRDIALLRNAGMYIDTAGDGTIGCCAFSWTPTWPSRHVLVYPAPRKIGQGIGQKLLDTTDSDL
jgi:hypothetical protein